MSPNDLPPELHLTPQAATPVIAAWKVMAMAGGVALFVIVLAWAMVWWAKYYETHANELAFRLLALRRRVSRADRERLRQTAQKLGMAPVALLLCPSAARAADTPGQARGKRAGVQSASRPGSGGRGGRLPGSSGR